MLMSVLLTTARVQSQPRCSPTDEQIKRTWYGHTKEFYSAIKKAIMTFAEKLIALRIILLSKISQTQKNK